MIIEVSEVNMADHEIQRLQRKLRAAEHRIEKLTKVHTSLQQGASKQAAVDQQKQKISEEVRKAREG
jgi:predicted transcriptional regulator